MLPLLADNGNSVVSPNLGLVLWTLLVLVLCAAVTYGVVRLVAHSRRDR